LEKAVCKKYTAFFVHFTRGFPAFAGEKIPRTNFGVKQKTDI
jgi:hypothetical protein